MKKKFNLVLVGLFLSLLVIVPSFSKAQSEKTIINKYLIELPAVSFNKTLQKYRMTAVYTNRDLYGKFIDKTKVSGDYTKGLENGFVTWNNIYISGSNNFSDTFPIGAKQEYMENIKYLPSSKMLDAEAFINFPTSMESVFAKNLIWDMMAIEGFAWDCTDSLKLNKSYRIPEIKGKFDMAGIGSYSHAEVQLCWTGISAIGDELCAVIEYRAIDNTIEMSMEGFKTKGTEQYWGTVWTSLKTKSIESAVMYGGSIQEIEVAGMANKFVVKTIRELWVDKIQ